MVAILLFRLACLQTTNPIPDIPQLKRSLRSNLLFPSTWPWLIFCKRLYLSPCSIYQMAILTRAKCGHCPTPSALQCKSHSIQLFLLLKLILRLANRYYLYSLKPVLPRLPPPSGMLKKLPGSLATGSPVPYATPLITASPQIFTTVL